MASGTAAGWTTRRLAKGREPHGHLRRRIALAFRPTERLKVDLTGIYQDSRDLGFGESFYAPTAGVRDYKNSTPLAAQSSNKLRNTLANLAIEYDAGGVTLFSSSTYQRRQTSAFQDVGFFNPYLGGLFGVPGLAGLAPNVIDTDSDIYTQELRASSSGTGPLRWTVGGFYLDATRNGTQLITSSAVAPIIGSNVLASLLSTGTQRELSGFGEVTYTFADRFDLTGGARVSRTTVDFDSASAGLLLTQNPNPAVVVSNRNLLKETNVNPRFSIAYRPNADATLYVQAARGYRVGGPNLSGKLAGGGVPLSYGSDSLWNYEAGVKTRLAGGRIRLSGAAFYVDWSNIQTSLSLNSVAYTGNAGAARIFGLELEAGLKVNDQFELGGSFTATNSEVTESTPNLTRVTGAVGVFAGERLPASPERQATGYAEFRQVVGGRPAYVRATAQYIGAQFTDFGEKGTRFGDFATVDLRSGVNLGPIEAVVFVNNLFDSQGVRSASDPLKIGASFVAVPQLAYRTRPRTVGVTLRARFGTEAR